MGRKKTAEDLKLLTIYCTRCGCPRVSARHPCPDCHDWEFSVIKNVQHAGWRKRQERARHSVQGELFDANE